MKGKIELLTTEITPYLKALELKQQVKEMKTKITLLRNSIFTQIPKQVYIPDHNIVF